MVSLVVVLVGVDSLVVFLVRLDSSVVFFVVDFLGVFFN
jgi:hypothetical protein